MTDNSSDTPNGVDTGVGEPSMEDILASIRRIIAEDEDTEQQHFDVDAFVEPEIVENADEPEPVKAFNAENSQEQESHDDDEDILVLDQLVSEAGLDAHELTSIETDEMIIDSNDTGSFNPVSSVVSDLEGRLSDENTVIEADSADDDDSVVFSLDDPSTSTLGMGPQYSRGYRPLLEDDPVETPAAEENPLEEFALEDLIQDEDDLSSSFDKELEDLELTDNESDLDIVKSLMADLTDTSFLDEPEENLQADPTAETEDDLLITQEEETLDDLMIEAMGELNTTEETTVNSEVSLADQLTESLIEEPVLESETSDIVASDETIVAKAEDDQDQIINDILELALQDEEGLDQAMDLAIDDDLTIPDFEAADAGEDSLLLQIAAEAEAEADAMDGSTALAAGAGVAAMAAANSKADPQEEMILTDEDTPSTEDLLNELDLALAEVTQDDNQDLAIPEPEPETESILDAAVTETETLDLIVEPEETEDMPRTARKDAIINEVTEEASADAFAQLSQAVEEKAVYTESGPRIGDIVQDALRPMLQEWLDENLKGIVERAVAKEVKRISSGK